MAVEGNAALFIRAVVVHLKIVNRAVDSNDITARRTLVVVSHGVNSPTGTLHPSIEGSK